MRLFHYPGCSTCRRASKLLAELGVAVEAIDLVATPPSVDTLRDLHARSGLPLKRLFNVSGRSYRGGGLKDRLPSMSVDAQLEALAADGKLIKRPILDAEAAVLVGFRADDWRGLLEEIP